MVARVLSVALVAGSALALAPGGLDGVTRHHQGSSTAPARVVGVRDETSVGAIRQSRRGALLGGVAAAFGTRPARAAETTAGLVIEDVQPGQGDGPPNVGQTVSIDFIGWLDGFDGEQVFIREKGPLYVELGAGRLPKGVEQTLLGMRVGGTRRVTISPDLAYGKTGYPRDGDKKGSIIPPDATLYFQVRLRSIKLNVGAFGLGVF